LKNAFGILVFLLDKGKVLSVAKIKTNRSLETLDVDILWEAARVGRRISESKFVI
jgi:hypothetical protein